MAKKVIEAVKKVAKKTVKKTAQKKVVKVVAEKCTDCNGRGLETSYTLCKFCRGSGTI